MSWQKGYAMKENRVIAFKKQEQTAHDPLTEIVRNGARKILAAAFEAEIEVFMSHYTDLKLENGKSRLIRNGYHPQREVLTGIGRLPVRVPRVRDNFTGEEKLIFSSKILPPYLRKVKDVEDVLPWLYLKGISTGDFQEALCSLLGEDAPGLSASVIGRLKNRWISEQDAWSKRDLSQKTFIYFWVDGIYFNVKMDETRHCMLVIIGACPDGRKELVAVADGYRESSDSWTSVLLDLKARGLKTAPKLAIGDGSLGFWKALKTVYPETRVQRCWMHKTGNILDKLPKSEQGRAKQMLHDVWLAATKAAATKAFDLFVATFNHKFPNATECLKKDKEELLAFYAFPAEHWVHIRTSNAIESTFSSVRLRTDKTKGCLGRSSMLAMVYKLAMSAQKQWRKMKGSEKLGELITGVVFIDGLRLAA